MTEADAWRGPPPAGATALQLHRVVVELLHAGDLPVTPLVTRLVPAAAAQSAFEQLDRGGPDALQVVLDFHPAAIDTGVRP